MKSATRTPHQEQSTLVAQSRIESPLGPITLAATAQGLALAWFDGQKHRTNTVNAPHDPDHPLLLQAQREFAAYWDDAYSPFCVALEPQGTPFQQSVWRVLRGVAPGRPVSYSDVARGIANPAAVRAVGAAIGRNPLAIIVPCHRVLGRDGSLTGYAGGLPRKQALLQHESSPGPRPIAASTSDQRNLLWGTVCKSPGNEAM